MTEEHSSPIKTPKQLIIVVLLAFAVPITVAVLISQLVTSGEQGSHENESIVLARIQPVGNFVLAEAGGPAAAPAVAAKPTVVASAAPAAAGTKPDGKQIYDGGCVACHGAGIAGAPKFGDKAAWAPRIATGMEALYAASLKGMGVMPPKGGNPALSDAEVKAAVDYMVGRSR
jgi:cytochrome c5